MHVHVVLRTRSTERGTSTGMHITSFLIPPAPLPGCGEGLATWRSERVVCVCVRGETQMSGRRDTTCTKNDCWMFSRHKC